MTANPIMLLSEVFPPRTGGSGRWFWELYRRLPTGEVVVAAGEHSRAAVFDRACALPVARLPLALPSWGLLDPAGARGYLRAYRAVRRLVRESGAREIHCGKALPEGWLAWLLRRRYGLPYLCYVHGEELNVAAQSRELAWLTERVLRGARRVIANSRATRAALERFAPPAAERVAVLHPGVDARRFTPAPPDPRARAALGWSGRTVILTVGRLQARKGHDQLIRALPQVRRIVPDVLYAIAGDGDQRARLEGLTDELNVREAVQFLGEIGDRELLACYQQCDLFALPNREVEGDAEGFGLVLLEAQACGRPVVAGDSGGTAETIRAPDTGRLVDCDTPEPLAATLAELLCDAPLRKAMGRAARRWIVERFDWNAIMPRAAALLTEGRGVK
jgi:phosphatidylinositol alpha-1,6-mannosyltransferase